MSTVWCQDWVSLEIAILVPTVMDLTSCLRPRLTTGRCPKSTSGRSRSLWGAVKWHTTHTHTHTHTYTCCPLPLLLSFFAFIHTHIHREKAWWVRCNLHRVSEFFYALQLFCRVRYLAYLYSAVISLFNLVFKFFSGGCGEWGPSIWHFRNCRTCSASVIWV